MASNHWKCPACSATVEKTDPQKIQQQAHEHGTVLVSVGSSGVAKCASCQHTVPLDELARGKFDVAVRARTFPCGHDRVEGRTNCPECYTTKNAGTCLIMGPLFGLVGTAMVMGLLEQNKVFKVEDHGLNGGHVLVGGAVLGLVAAIVLLVRQAKKDF